MFEQILTVVVYISMTHAFVYKGVSVELSAAGHPQVQNIAFNGVPVGSVVFPFSGVDRAKQMIDKGIGIAQAAERANRESRQDHWAPQPE